MRPHAEHNPRRAHIATTGHSLKKQRRCQRLTKQAKDTGRDVDFLDDMFLLEQRGHEKRRKAIQAFLQPIRSTTEVEVGIVQSRARIRPACRRGNKRLEVRRTWVLAAPLRETWGGLCNYQHPQFS